MDFCGQRLAEQLMFWFIIAIAAVSFVVGYSLGDFRMMCFINGGGCIMLQGTEYLILAWPVKCVPHQPCSC